MKKGLTFFLCLSLLVALVASFAVTASADEVEVTVGQEFSYNYQGDSKETIAAWRKSNTSPDGCWKYQFYSTVKNIYQDMKFNTGNFYSWNGEAANGNGDLDYVLVRDYGRNFHPGFKGDVCKVFICPAAGHVTLRTSVARVNDYVQGKGTPTGIAIWLGKDTQLYPTDGTDYASLTSSKPTEINVEADVLKGQYIYIRINCIEGDRGSDAVTMENFAVYTSVDQNGETVEAPTDTITLKPVEDVTVPGYTNQGGNGSTTYVPKTDGGSSVGVVIGIIAAVVVCGAVVAVVVLKKKKK